MKKSWPLVAAIVAHGLLIGLLTGLSLSPIVGIVLPLLMGVSGYKLLDFLTGNSSSASATQLSAPRVAAGVALWCVVVIVAIFGGIGLRTGDLHWASKPPRTLSLLHIERQPIRRIPPLTLICAYVDQMDVSPTERKAIATALADSTIDADVILGSLKDYFSSSHAEAVTPQRSQIGVFEYRPRSTH